MHSPTLLVIISRVRYPSKYCMLEYWTVTRPPITYLLRLPKLARSPAI